MHPQPFGLYTLIHRINVGGMAEVFKACYYDNGQPAFAAIKRILPHLAQDRSFIDMFITEAHTAGRLVHSNIAQIIEQGEEEGEYYISMEYVSGRDLLYLRHHLRERGMFFPPALAAYVMMGVASALDYAHRLCDPDEQHLEIIHRDVSPQNILISYDGEVKLIDFGIAKAKVRTQEHTRAGVLKGKFGYMAPEQVKGHAIDHRADIFALGTVFYELLTNQRLFMGDSDIETLEMVREARVVPPSSINEWIPPQLDQIILLALQPDPQHRFESAGDLAQALHFYLQQEAPMTHENTLKTWMAQEFSTFIAHEKAQDAYLLEQMLQNIADQQEDMDSTSLISADAIEMLNQYTAQQLGQRESQIDHEDITGPIDFGEHWNENSPHEHHDTTPPSDPVLDEQPATRQVNADLYYGLKQPIYAKPHTPYLSPQEVHKDESLDEQHLEDLFEESFDDQDESGISQIDGNLDQILAQSLTHGQRSPLAIQPQINQPQINQLQINQPQINQPQINQPHVKSGFDSSVQPVAAMQGQSSLHNEPTPKPKQGLLHRPTDIQQPVEQVGLSAPPLFSEHEPTPIPNMRASLRASRQSKNGSHASTVKGLLKVIAAVVLLAVLGGGVWFYSQSLAPTPVLLEVQPFGRTTIQIGMLPPISSTKQQVINLSSPQKIVVRHPDLPVWERFVDPSQLPDKKLVINLETKATHYPIKVISNKPEAEVWVFGTLRGKTPYQGSVPLNTRGEVDVQVKLSGYESVGKRLSLKRKNGKPLFYYAPF